MCFIVSFSHSKSVSCHVFTVFCYLLFLVFFHFLYVFHFSSIFMCVFFVIHVIVICVFSFLSLFLFVFFSSCILLVFFLSLLSFVFSFFFFLYLSFCFKCMFILFSFIPNTMIQTQSTFACFIHSNICNKQSFTIIHHKVSLLLRNSLEKHLATIP